MEEKDINKNKFELGPITKHIAFFLIGWIGLSLVATIVFIFVELIVGPEPSEIAKIGANVATNFFAYLITGAILIVVRIGDVLKGVLAQFKNKHALIDGIAYGFLVMGATAAVTVVVDALRGGAGDINSNESTIRLMTSAYPIPLFFMTAIFAPIVEEYTYRLGLFNVLSRKNRWLAYGVSALVFGLIHVNFEATGEELINELWNLPSYVVSGLILCRAYEKHKCISTSIIAHAINNGIAIIAQILLG